MPELPTPGVKGQVVSLPALQASMSISSFEPAARIFGWFASTAKAGSFCLFCEKGLAGLPTLTSVSPGLAEAGSTVAKIATNAIRTEIFFMLRLSPLAGAATSLSRRGLC
jgi:hypothetical protein